MPSRAMTWNRLCTPAPPELDCRDCPNSNFRGFRVQGLGCFSQSLGRAFFASHGVGEEVHRAIPGLIGLFAWKLRALCSDMLSVPCGY